METEVFSEISLIFYRNLRRHIPERSFEIATFGNLAVLKNHRILGPRSSGCDVVVFGYGVRFAATSDPLHRLRGKF